MLMIFKYKDTPKVSKYIRMGSEKLLKASDYFQQRLSHIFSLETNSIIQNQASKYIFKYISLQLVGMYSGLPFYLY